MPRAINGDWIEAIDCASCNASLSWQGDLPEDPAEWLCHACAEDEAYAKGQRETVARIVAWLRSDKYAFPASQVIAEDIATRLGKGDWKEGDRE